MRKLIYITGSLENPFFLNEIGYIRSCFEDVFVITYDGDIYKSNEIARKYNLRYKKISMTRDLLKGISYFISWLFSNHVKVEIKQIIHQEHFIKKLLYIIYYGIFDSIGSSLIEKESRNYQGEIVLYSFWLSKGAYCIARNSKRSNVKYSISRAHGYDLYLERNELEYLPFRNFINKKLDCIAFISYNGYKYFNSKYQSGKDYSQKTVISLGVSASMWRKTKRNNDTIVFASCSSCIELKRLDLIASYIKSLGLNTNKHVLWIHIGDGPLWDNYRDLKLGSNVEAIFMGKIDNNQVREIYKEYNVDFFINLSDSEGIPVSIMEAMSCGIPCIARNVGGVSEIVDSNNGIIISEPKINSRIINRYTRRNIDIYEDVQLYNAKSYLSYCKWFEDYNTEKNSRKFIEIITNKDE